MQIATDPDSNPGLELQRDLSTRPVTARTAGTILPGNTEDQTWSWPSAWGLCIYSGNTGKDQTLVLWECETDRASVCKQGKSGDDKGIGNKTLRFSQNPFLDAEYPHHGWALAPAAQSLCCIPSLSIRSLVLNVLNLWDVDYDKATKRLSH